MNLFFYPINLYKMNKFYSTLAAIAVLTSGNILAQDAAALTNSLDATSAFDCSYDVKDADNTILLNGSSATQIFTACTDGKLLEVSLDIKGLNDRGTYTVEVRSMNGEILNLASFKKEQVLDGKVVLPMETHVKSGARYILNVTAETGYDLSLRSKQGPMGTLTIDGTPYRGQLAGQFGFKTVNATTLANDEGRVAYGGDDSITPLNKSANGLCNTEVYNHTGRIVTTGESIVQTFTACSNGFLSQTSVQIQHIDADFVGRLFIKDPHNTVLLSQEVTARNVRDGVLVVPMNIKVREGFTYKIGVKSIYETRLAVQANNKPADALGTCTFNGTELETNLCFSALVRENQNDDDPSTFIESTLKVIAFPNPFENELGIRIDGIEEGKVIVQLIDFTGNVLRADLINIDPDNKVITFNTDDIDEVGFYSLRVVHGDKVTHTTVIKH